MKRFRKRSRQVGKEMFAKEYGSGSSKAMIAGRPSRLPRANFQLGQRFNYMKNPPYFDGMGLQPIP